MTDPELAGCTLLLVDDEEANLDLLEDFLERAGHRSLVRVSDARQAVEVFERVRPDAVLLDLHMPHRSGFEVLADLRARMAPNEFLPVLVLTADATFDAKRRALQGGAADFLTKPFQNDEVLLRVRNLLQMRLLLAEQRRARRAAELLAETSRLLGDSLDGTTAAERLAAALVGWLADRCAVELCDAAGAAFRAAEAAAPAPAGAGDGGEPHRLRLPLRAGERELGTLTLERAAGRGPYSAAGVALGQEIARRLALALENAWLFRDLRAAVEARERTLAVVAHELRSPLTAIRSDAEMLCARLGAPEAGGDARRVHRIDRAAGRMDAMIEDLLELARAEGGRVWVRPAPLPLEGLLHEAAEALRPLAGTHGIELRVGGPGPGCAVLADGPRVQQVLVNLLGNAVKFTPAGGRITLSAAADGHWAHLRVADTGPGLGPEELPHVFGAFWQARAADRRGLGLGLAIARGIVDAHGGRIWVESEPGRGAVFQFTLPLAGPEDAPPPSPDAAP